jgi:Tol biopolymer transport system component
VTALTTGSGHHDEDPAWSPDGARLAFSTTHFDAPTYGVAVMDVATGHLERVTDHVTFESHAAWTADGRGLLFSSERDGTQAVFRVAYTRLAAGGSCVEILDVPTGHTHRIGVDGLATLQNRRGHPTGSGWSRPDRPQATARKTGT